MENGKWMARATILHLLLACLLSKKQGYKLVMVSYQGQTGWVFADDINIDGDVNQLSIVGEVDRPTVHQKNRLQIYIKKTTRPTYFVKTHKKIWQLYNLQNHKSVLFISTID